MTAVLFLPFQSLHFSFFLCLTASPVQCWISDIKIILALFLIFKVLCSKFPHSGCYLVWGFCCCSLSGEVYFSPFQFNSEVIFKWKVKFEFCQMIFFFNFWDGIDFLFQSSVWQLSNFSNFKPSYMLGIPKLDMTCSGFFIHWSQLANRVFRR